MTKCAIYCRVSSEDQAEKGTIEGQVQYATKYLDLHGAEAGILQHEFYLDEGVSGTVPLQDRPAGARLVADAKAGKFQSLYVYRLDRLARSVKYVLETYDFLDKQGISLKSMTEAFDTGTPTGKFFMTLLASIAALERDTILERTQLGKDRSARQGRWASGAPPFGYRIGQGGRLEIYEPEAETIRLIFRLYQDGMSTIELATYLNARGVPTPAKSKGTNNISTGKWHAAHISILLRTRAYIGTYTYLKRSKRRKDTIEMEVPAIVEKRIFSAIQVKLTENADIARGNRGRYYLLRGLIYCGNCGRAMVGNSGMSKEGRVYYRCTGTVNNGAGRQCKARMIRAAEIEEAVWRDIQEYIQIPGKVQEIIEVKTVEGRKDVGPLRQELDQVEKAILEKQVARGKVLSLYTRGVVTDQEAEKELQTLAAENSSLTARRELLSTREEASRQFRTEALSAQLLLESLADKLKKLPDERKAEAIRALVKRIDVYASQGNNGCKWKSRVVIHYRFEEPTALDGPKHNRKCLKQTKNFSTTCSPCLRRVTSRPAAML